MAAKSQKLALGAREPLMLLHQQEKIHLCFICLVSISILEKTPFPPLFIVSIIEKTPFPPLFSRLVILLARTSFVIYVLRKKL